jgi:hypothetical protein
MKLSEAMSHSRDTGCAFVRNHLQHLYPGLRGVVVTIPSRRPLKVNSHNVLYGKRLWFHLFDVSALQPEYSVTPAGKCEIVGSD